jgi:GMP synthase-like glutamine amidotransferase
MKVLIVEHAPRRAEGIDTQVISRGHEPLIWRPYLMTEPVPKAAHFQALIIGGGPMGAYEMGKYPFFNDEFPLIVQALAENVPTFGICLGAQIVAHFFGGRVEETYWRRGFMEVNTVNMENDDGFLRGVAHTFPTFEFHKDEITALPEDATVVLSSDNCAIEGFRFNGGSFWGVQSHPEIRVPKATAILAANEITGVESEPFLALGHDARMKNNNLLFYNFLTLAEKGQ